MLMLSALRNRALSRLWLGQALSSIGDEIYRVGLTWLAVGLLGNDTGYLAAGQAAALMLLSFIGGKWADSWEPMRTMIRVDFIRACVVLIPVIVSFFCPVPLSVIVAVALTLSALGAFFDPALQTTLPLVATDLPLLRAATGLMSTTIRMARMVGPTIVGLLAGFVPMIHFLTLDALSFLISALSVRSLRRHAPELKPQEGGQQSFTQTLKVGFRLVRSEPGMRYVMWARAVTSGAWNLALMVGFALLVQQLAPNDARAFGAVMASYGAGNFAGALYFGNHQRSRSGLLMFGGYASLGVGFVLVGSAPTIHWVMACAVLTGFTGPMNDLAFTDLTQARFAIQDIPRIFRLRMATEMLATLVTTGISPLLFRVLSVRGTIILCGLVWIGAGVFGLAQLEEIEPRWRKTAAPAAQPEPPLH